MKNILIARWALLMSLVIVASGCQKAYYAGYYKFWETLGSEKRDLLVSELSKANGDQAALKNQFSDTLQRVRVEYGFNEGKLGKVYDSMSADYESAEAKYERLHDRIIVIQTIANDLFKEWAREAREIEDKSMRESSLAQLEQSKAQFQQTNARLQDVDKKVKPVLKTLRSHVLYLKHNLNAKAVGSLESDLKSIAPEIELLIKSLEQSINSAKAFEQNIAQTGV